MQLFGREYLVDPPGLSEQCAESQREADGGHEAPGLQGDQIPKNYANTFFCTSARFSAHVFHLPSDLCENKLCHFQVKYNETIKVEKQEIRFFFHFVFCKLAEWGEDRYLYPVAKVRSIPRSML